MDMNEKRLLGKGVAALVLWTAVYAANDSLAAWLTYGLLGLAPESTAGGAVRFFVYDTVKILLLLGLMVYGVAFARAGLRTERLRARLAGTRRGVGYALGAAFGAVTPFCSCSSIPLFVGFTTAKIPFGITMSFLITSPMINEIAVIMLGSLLGWPFALAYVATGMLAGIAGGLFMDAIRADRWLRPLAKPKPGLVELRPICACGAAPSPRPSWEERHRFALGETRNIFRKVAPWAVAGVGVGALLHGYVPEAWVVEHLGAGQWWTVPVAAAAGIPLYANVTGVVPVLESLLLKGVPAGTALAFCLGTVAVSLPELLMLRQVMRGKLLALFLGVLFVFCTLAGWLFNATPLLSLSGTL